MARMLYMGHEYLLEERDDGWHFRMRYFSKGWKGPFATLKECVTSMAEEELYEEHGFFLSYNKWRCSFRGDALVFIIIGAFYRVEKREDGYYFRSVANVYTSWRGPYLNYGEVAEEMADDLQEEMELAPLL